MGLVCVERGAHVSMAWLRQKEEGKEKGQMWNEMRNAWRLWEVRRSRKAALPPVRLSIGTSSWLNRGERLGQLIIETERDDNWVIRGAIRSREDSGQYCRATYPPSTIFPTQFCVFNLKFSPFIMKSYPASQPNRHPEKIRMVSLLYSGNSISLE